MATGREDGGREPLFVLNVAGRQVLYAPWSNTCRLAPTAADPAAPGLTGAGDPATWAPAGPSAPPLWPPSPARPFDPPFLGFIPSRACNMACLYCDFDGDSPGTLDRAAAETALRWFTHHCRERGRSVVDVQFFGGEPFVELPLVAAIVRRARALADEAGLTAHLGACTNGVLSPEAAGLVATFNSVQLSFDGTAEIHDRHRRLIGGGATSRRVLETAERLCRSPVDLSFRCCVTSESVQELPAVAEALAERYCPSTIGFEPLSENRLSRAAGLSAPDPYEFALRFLEASRRLRHHTTRVVYSAVCGEGPRQSGCPVGSDGCIVGSDGSLRACYLPPGSWRARGLDLTFGRVTDGRVQVDDASVLRNRDLALTKPRCSGCFCRWTCGGGCHVNHSYPGCAGSYDAYCIQTRIIVVAQLLERMGERALQDALLGSGAALERLAEGAEIVLERLPGASVDDRGPARVEWRRPTGQPRAAVASLPEVPWTIPYADGPLAPWRELRDLLGARVARVSLPLLVEEDHRRSPSQPAAHLDSYLAESPFPISLLVLAVTAGRERSAVIEAIRELHDVCSLSEVAVADLSLALAVRGTIESLRVALMLPEGVTLRQLATLEGTVGAVIPPASFAADPRRLRELRRAYSGVVRLRLDDRCVYAGPALRDRPDQTAGDVVASEVPPTPFDGLDLRGLGVPVQLLPACCGLYDELELGPAVAQQPWERYVAAVCASVQGTLCRFLDTAVSEPATAPQTQPPGNACETCRRAATTPGHGA